MCLFMWRNQGRDEPDLIQLALLTTLLGQNQMAEMYRIECATKDADPHLFRYLFAAIEPSKRNRETHESHSNRM